MKNNQFLRRLLAVALVVCILAAWVLPANVFATKLGFTQVSNDRVLANLLGKDAVQLSGNQPEYAATDVVRVSIFLDKAGVIDAGYSVDGLAQNDAAMAYRNELKKVQTSVINKIENATKEKLEVVWNLTLAANLISANVQYGQIAAIKNIKGVRNVVIETEYEPDVAEKAPADPNMATSSVQTGTAGSYASGYTGAGSRIAIIDTGLDIDHLSFDSGAFEYSLNALAEKEGVDVDTYINALDLLDAEEIAAVLGELNVMDRANVSAEDMYIDTKIPFGFNYVDGNTNVTHLYDTNGEHGSHVAGISAANAYVPNEDGTYSNALEEVHVQGIAPDAQLIIMKVFGANGGAYPADYMAAIEDAILLGADSVNLSLGGGNPGMSAADDEEFQNIFNNLEKSGVVVSISAGNSGAWMDSAESAPYLYLDDVSMHTSGSPGTYTNSLGVASVNNAGYVTPYFVVEDTIISYTESAYRNAPFATLAGTQEYVFLNGIGTPEQFAALGEGALDGKIAMCYRGETSFFEKAEAAVEAGAIGVIIVNNQDGMIGMDLSDYSYTAPVVSITQADGELFKETAVLDDAGNVQCWIGTMEVSEGSEVFMYGEPYYTMSSFSSWGVPGSLIMKPEITAPGGEILSVGGAYYYPGGGINDHVTYELMSGTSMAAPQVAGMAALVAQYIRENDLTTKTGLDARTLAQSLLMSTAVPLFDGESGGNYYPVLQQGSGLANVGAAVLADSYILMNADATASYADGKVKVELGHDPAKEGVYKFSFTINNLTDADDTYALYADFFTQSAFNGGNALYLDTWTENLYPVVVFTVNGEEIEGGADMLGMDFNGDGKVNSADGQALLDYATGVRDSLFNADNADLNTDGKINSYDSYLFFQLLGESGALVPANGSVTVEVTVTLSDSDKEWLSYYENGAYLEGFVYAQSAADAEGVEGTCHSIPVLGFYGNWSDPSMFDKGSYEEYALSGEEYRAPYLYESAFAYGNMNSLYIKYADDPANDYYFGGNPIVEDAVYMPERNAISAVNGDKISTIGFTSIRNAGASFYQVLDLTNGQVLINEPLGSINSAYYYVNGQQWKNTYWTLNSNLNPSFAEDNTVLDVGICLVPEYFVDAEGNVDWASLGGGTTFSMSMTVDNTAPVLNDVALSLMNNTMTVKATDNQYIAAIALFDQYGEYRYLLEGSQADAQPGVATEYVLDLSNVAGTGFLLQVYDYAMNCTTYEIDTQIGDVVDTVEKVVISKSSLVMQKGNTAKLSAVVYPPNASDRSVVWSSTNESVVTVDDNGNILAVSEGKAQIIAAAALDETITAVCNVEVIDIAIDLNGIVWDEEGSIWFSEFNTATLPEYTKLSGDMLDTDYLASAAMAPDGTLYASSFNPNNGTGALYTIDPETYEATKLNDCIVQGLHIFYSDLTYAPAMFGTGVLLGTYGPYVIAIDPVSGEAYGIIDEYDSDLVGITTCYGEYHEDTGEYEDTVYVIQNDGTAIQEIYYGYEGAVVPYIYYFYEMRATMDIGVSVGDAWYYNSAYFDAENAMLFWSAFDPDNENAVTLYAIDDYTGDVYNLGQFGEGVWPVGGLYKDKVSAASEGTMQKFANLKTEMAGKVIEPKTYQLEKIEIVKEKLSAPELPALPMSGAQIGEGEDTVTVTITAKDATGENIASTNAVATVTYDSAALVLKSVVVNGDYTSKLEGDGFVTFGYVKLDGFAADDVVATLVFEVVDTDVPGVKVTNKEVNDADSEYEEDVDITFPHANTEIRDYQAPTCTEPGYTGDTYCTDCGKLIEEGKEIAVVPHAYQAFKYIGADTSKALAVTDLIASSFVEAGDPEHLFDGVVSMHNKWCAKDNGSWVAFQTEEPVILGGYSIFNSSESYARRTGAWRLQRLNTYLVSEEDYQAMSEEEKLAVLADENNWITIHAVTNNTAEQYDATIDAADLALAQVYRLVVDQREQYDHDEWSAVRVEELVLYAAATESTVVAPTCTEQGYTTFICMNCGDSYVGDYVEATGHSFGEWEETKAPTCTEGGEETRTCHCGETETQEVAATGHAYESVVTDPTCTEQGYTTHTCHCGDNYMDSFVEATGHAFGEWEETKAPTCTEAGEETRTCHCGETETQEVAATGHSYKDVVTPPTTEAEGYTTHTCEHCGDSYVDSYTDKLPQPDPDNGKTGDTFMAPMWIAAMLVSATALAVLVIYRKRSFQG